MDNNNYQNNNHPEYQGDKVNYRHRQRRNKEEYQVPVDTSLFKNDAKSKELIEPITSFEDLGLSDKILRGVFGYGFENPSPIQQRAIRPFLEGREIIAQAQSGTGKTGTFCLSVLGRVDTTLNQTQALILAHTRELASQIDMVMRKLSSFTDVICNLSVKGIPISENIEELCKNPN